MSYAEVIETAGYCMIVVKKGLLSAVCELRGGERAWLKSSFARPRVEDGFYTLLAFRCWLLAVAVTGDKGQETLCDHWALCRQTHTRSVTIGRCR